VGQLSTTKLKKKQGFRRMIKDLLSFMLVITILAIIFAVIFFWPEVKGFTGDFLYEIKR